MRLSVAAYAKLNLTLDVIGKLPNGYHELRMVMQSISLQDRISIETGTEGGIVIRSNRRDLPMDEHNLAWKAASAFLKAREIPETGITIAIEKHIPVAAGLAGGSTDAAAVIRGLDVAYNTRCTNEELREIGLRVGADVPFCITGGTQLAGGVGEQLSPLAPLPDCAIVLVKPAFSMSTPYVFSTLDRIGITHRPDAAGMAEALTRGDLRGVTDRLCNVMELVTAAEHPEIGQIKARLLDFGALGAVMSGSGPSVFGIFDDDARARAAYAALLPDYESVHLCRPASRCSRADILTDED